MPQQLSDIIQFRGDRLFNGAVNIQWFGSDPTRCRQASEAFVFHGPQYHGVQQEDVGKDHGHRLTDTASFARAVVRRCYGNEDQPFTLAIAGYGTGKSHLALTLATLLSDPSGDAANAILTALKAADETVGSDVAALLRESEQPCLVVALNGMQSFDLGAEITKQITRTLKSQGLSTAAIENLRPRFGQAASLIRMSNEGVLKDLLDACGTNDVQTVLSGLEQQDETTYSKVHTFFSARGMTIQALGGESLKDVIDLVVHEYCGEAKHFRSLAILFDEFGRYIEFATIRSQIAGSGVLQDLFEAIQANPVSTCFVGFIQFELNAYVQRIAPEYRNDILRYVTRYQTADRAYLSINLETLIASLLEKRLPERLNDRFDSDSARTESEEARACLARWFPQTENHRLWTQPTQFHTVVRKGCWPLSPYATWLLFHLASGGKHLQERSALALLGDLMQRRGTDSLPDLGNWALAPVDLWSDALQQDLLTSEESGQQGAVAHALATVNAKHGGHLTGDLQRLLRAVVLASKMGLQAIHQDDAIEALAELAGLPLSAADRAAKLLREEYHVLEWNESFKQFEILGDGATRSQFLSFIRSRVASIYDEAGKAKLFASKAVTWCDLLRDLDDCDFNDANQITTREWRYQREVTYLELVPHQVKLATERWRRAIGVDEPRGTIIYCYVEPSRDPAQMSEDVAKLLRGAARDSEVPVLPILVVMLCDEKGDLGQTLAEVATIEESLTADDKARFGNLIAAHSEKARQALRDQVGAMIKQRRYVTGLKEPLEARLLSRAGTELFGRAYKSPIAFPFDGFSVAKGNAADTCQELTLELLSGKLDYETVMAKIPKTKNRAVTVLQQKWGIFNRNGAVSRRPTYSVLKNITEKWDDALASGSRKLSISGALRELCLPPFGANIASAGLFLGVYVAPRAEQLVVLQPDGRQLLISQWLEAGIFRGKFIDLATIGNADLISVGEASAEWQNLLDEWEQAESHLARRGCAERATELANRIPVPPALAYREMHLRDQAKASVAALSRFDDDQGAAMDKIFNGLERNEVSLISWGASLLKKLKDRLKAEGPLWTSQQLADIDPHLEKARQTLVVCFNGWLGRQAPKSESPDVVGEFKNRMRLVATNLRQIAFEDLAVQLDAWVLKVVRNAESAAEAHQVVRDVNSWLLKNSDVQITGGVAAVRALRTTAREYSSKLQGLQERIDIADIAQTRERLAVFSTGLKNREQEITKRGGKLWHTKIHSGDDLELLIAEVDAVLSLYDEVPDDQASFRSMRNALRVYQRHFQLLVDDKLTWTELEKSVAQLTTDARSALGEAEEDLPWLPEDVMNAFSEAIAKRRKEASLKWIEALEDEVAKLATLSSAELSRMQSRASNIPAFLTEPHGKRAKAALKAVEDRLSEQAVEWLIEKYCALPPAAKSQFRKKFSELTKT